MAEAPNSLGELFAKKKKKIKGSNLNVETNKPVGEDTKNKATKEKEDADKDEEQTNDSGLKVQVVGKLVKEDDKKDDDDRAAPAWRTKASEQKNSLDERRYPTLRKAVGQSSNINIDDGQNTTVNIKTSKNIFEALHNDDDEDDEAPKRPKEIKPYLAQKQKGEMVSSAVQREVDKYGGDVKKSAAAGSSKAKKKKAKEVESSDEEEDSDQEAAKKKREEETTAASPSKQVQVADMEDLKIVPDLEASRRKYQGREKLPSKRLPVSELEEEKENNPVEAAAPVGKKGKKKNVMEEDFGKPKPKVLEAPDDW